MRSRTTALAALIALLLTVGGTGLAGAKSLSATDKANHVTQTLTTYYGISAGCIQIQSVAVAWTRDSSYATSVNSHFVGGTYGTTCSTGQPMSPQYEVPSGGGYANFALTGTTTTWSHALNWPWEVLSDQNLPTTFTMWTASVIYRNRAYSPGPCTSVAFMGSIQC